MYGNMTREEMIQRLYEGNFTTGELERQLIAKLFEQCCGGGGSSGGGGVFVVHDVEGKTTGKDRLDKTAAEILEASKTMLVMLVNYYEDEEETSVQNYFIGEALKEDNNYIFKFYYNSQNGNETGANAYCKQYRAANDDDYPLVYFNGGGESSIQ